MVDKTNTIVEDDENLSADDDTVIIVEGEEEQGSDERLSSEARDDEDEDGNKKGSAGYHAKKRTKRKQAMERDKAQIDALRRYNEELAARLAAIESRSSQQDYAMLDQRLNETQGHIQNAERFLADAVSRGDGTEVAKALRYRDDALAQARQLDMAKRQATEADRQAPRIDPRIKEHADDWMGDNPWYDPKGRDEDSAIVLAIDETLAREGFRPETPEYWDELQDRVERRLPHKFEKGGQAKAPTKRGPPIGGGREHAPPSTRKEIHVSRERKEALIEAGYWDDPQKRAKALKRMADWDRQNLASR